MADRRAPWWFWTYLVASFVIGVGAIVASLSDPDPWWSWLPHLLQAVSLVAFALFFVAVGPLPRRRRQRLKKRSLPPL
ncbi:hypothetical protein ACFWP5_25750 [Streptomyces sp. NPDC058469]|uniref:hypothetical protein n=1 Tax=Streptomyces sp. NPDC058469 TaxID=3346514 RepID=UPI003654ABC4